MVRTTLSFCALFGCLIAGFALLSSSQQDEPPASAPVTSGPDTHPEGSPAPPRLATGIQEKTASTHPTSATRQVEMECGSDRDLAGVSLLPQGTEFFSLVGFESDVAPAQAEASVTDNDDVQGDSGTEADFFAENLLAEEVIEDGVPTEEPIKGTTPGASSEPAEIKPEEPKALPESVKPLTPELLLLREKLRDTLAWYHQHPENVALRSPWGSMHAMIAYGVDTELIAQNRKVNAIGYLCFNGSCNGQTLFHTQNGKLQAKIGVGVQGHAGQFLAMLAQSRVRTDYPIKVDGQDFTVADLVEHEKITCRPRTELTFKLIALTHYLKSDETWKSSDGQDWDIPRLIKEELAQPIIGAACGGTHRLTGFSYAVRKREQRGEEIAGQWLRAQKFIGDYHDYTFKIQNPDGSFSTAYFVGREDNGPPARRLETTGHITEWLAFSLSEDELRSPQMVKAVGYLTELLHHGRDEKWAIGPLGHGLHALAIYDERVFGGKPGARTEELARQVAKPILKRK